MDWTSQARALIAEKACRCLSPSFYHTKAGNIITRLKGAGLVHNPNLHLLALASEQDDSTGATDTLERIMVMLNLPEDTAHADLPAVIARLLETAEAPATAAQLITPDPARFAPIEAVRDLMARHRAPLADQHAKQAEAKVDDALWRGLTTSTMEGWAAAPCARDQARFDDFVANAMPAFGHLTRSHVPEGAPPDQSERHQTDAAEAVCSQRGLVPGRLKG